MGAAIKTMLEVNLAHDMERPIVVIGTGPVGVRVAQSMLRENPDQQLVIYGNEPWEPYNRVQLSSFLAGELDWLGLTDSQLIPDMTNVTQVHNCEVIYIDRGQRYVIDQLERIQPYEKLIIATGSSPHVPSIPGIDKQHVYRFRSMDDVNQLLARQVGSRKTVVLGGGLLGLEAARAMQRQNTQVTIVDHAQHLMYQQLDHEAAELLRGHVMSVGIKVQLGQGVVAIEGNGSVTGVKLRNNKIIDCDTVIVATGIKPNIALARNARLKFSKGIYVNDRMQTSDPHIYAVGECAEHRGTVYGLVGPGYEQAGVVVQSLLDKTPEYKGSINATKLKVVGIQAFSMGDSNKDGDPGHFYKDHVYYHPEKNIYRKLVLKNGRLVGGIAIGKWEEIGRIQESISQQRRIWPWQINRFIRTGMLWDVPQSDQVGQWPSATTVCQCMSVSRGQLSKAINAGCASVEALKHKTGASSVCGGCQPLLVSLLGSKVQAEKIGAFKTIFALSLLAIFFTSLISLYSPIPFQDSVIHGINWDHLWRDKLIKQITGYSILGLSVLGGILTLRKRIKRISWFDFSIWRLVHITSGVLIVAGLIAHSGFRFGQNINFYLMLDFVALLVLGGIAGAVMAMQYKLDVVRAASIKKFLLWCHILLLWPLPVLLGFHIIQTYYF